MDFFSIVLGTIVSSAVSGVIGNRADAAVMRGYRTIEDALRHSQAPVDLELRKAVRRSFLLALLSIISDAHKELAGAFSSKYRGHLVYPPQHAADLRWLDQKRKLLEQELKQLQKAGEVVVSLGSLSEMESFLVPEGQTAATITQTVKQKLIDEALAEGSVPACYEAKLKQEQAGLFERMCACFSLEIAHNQVVHNFFTGQILTQINATQADQQLTLEDLSTSLQSLAQDVPQLIETLKVIEENQTTLWQGVEYLVAVSTTSATSIEEIKALLLQLIETDRDLPVVKEPAKLDSVVMLPSNPFLPLNGRIDDPQQLFGRERELTKIFEVLNSGSSVALIGERAIGKSSLLQCVCTQAEQRLRFPRKPIYLDLKLIENEDEFYDAFCELAEVPTSKGFSLRRALRSRRLLLVVDEVEKMTWTSFTREIRSQLRGLAEGSDAPLRLVLAACQSLDRLFPDSDVDGVSPLAGICLEERIGLWDEPTMQTFIEARLAQTPIRFTDAEIKQVVQTSGGYPQKLMQACYRLYSQYQEPQS